MPGHFLMVSADRYEKGVWPDTAACEDEAKVPKPEVGGRRPGTDQPAVRTITLVQLEAFMGGIHPDHLERGF